MGREQDILRPFLDFISYLTSEERIWLIDQFGEYYCTKCGEDLAESFECNEE
jgi:hypothetical protein